MTTSVHLSPGDRLGGYRIDGTIASGGMAVVYRAVQLSLDRPVALKVLSGPLTRDPDFRERFRREAQHAALDHPHIVPVYDSGECDELLFIAMRLIDGGTLADRLAGDGFSPVEALALLRPIAGALDAVHEAGLVHRDIKPQNIMLGRDGRPYLADFGIAKGSEATFVASSGGFVGSVNYASPEQIRSEPLTPASDIYSFTAMAFQCLTGQLPYPRETDAGVVYAHLEEPPPRLPVGGMPAAEGLQEAIARGMAKTKTERFRSATELIDAIAASINALPTAERNQRAMFGGFVRVPPPAGVAAPSGPEGKTRADRARSVDGVQAGAARRAWWQSAAARVTQRPLGPTTDRGWLAAAIAIAILAPLAVLLFAGGGDAPAPAQTAASALVSVAYRSPWVAQPATSQPIEGLAITRPAALSTTGPAGETAVVRIGRLTDLAPVAAGLPAALRRRFAGDGPTATTVRTGDVVARRYSGRLARGGALTVLVAATDRGDVAVGCERPAVPTLPASLCDRVLASTSLQDVRALRPGPDAALATGLAAALAPLAQARSAAALDVTGLKERAERIRTLGAAAGRTATALGELSPRPRDRAAVARAEAALSGEAAALDDLADATPKRRAAAYKSAQSRVATAQRRLNAALALLARRGYRVAAGGTS